MQKEKVLSVLKILGLKSLKFGGLFLVFCFVAWNSLILLIYPINRILNLPNTNKLKDYAPISSIEVYDRKDQLVSLIQSEEDRQIIALDQVSVYLKQALIATEDRDFYSHRGIDIKGILRAIFVNLKSGELKEGASTLTQQLVKNVFFHPSEWRTIQRKLKEFLIALEVEKNYSKEEILEAYLNQVFWGNGAYGVQRAAQKYFNKNANKLNLAESAYLVGLLTSPSSLHGNKAGKERQARILFQMEKNKYITSEQREKALKQELKFESAPGNLAKFPFYMSVVLEELKKHLNENEIQKLGLKIYTALDQNIQRKSKEILEKKIKAAPRGISQGALVLVDVPTNQVRSIVGGVGDFWKHQWNRATSPHTMGSVFKPFVYLTSFEKGLYTANASVLDTPFIYTNSETNEIWKPNNFDKKFKGRIDIKTALTYSRNIPAIRVAKHTKIEDIQEMASRFGLQIEPFLSSALGSSAASPLELANAYATLARRGVFTEPVVIRRIEDREGNILFQSEPKFSRVASANVVDELVGILQNVVQRGTGRAALIRELSIAGKTGTSDNSRDVWFAGFTPDSAIVLWGGNDHNKEASYYATGGGVMAGIWKAVMQEYLKENSPRIQKFPQVPSKKRLTVDAVTLKLPSKHTQYRESRDFIPGTEPTEKSHKASQEEIDDYFERNFSDDRFSLIETEAMIEDNLEIIDIDSPVYYSPQRRSLPAHSQSPYQYSREQTERTRTEQPTRQPKAKTKLWKRKETTPQNYNPYFYQENKPEVQVRSPSKRRESNLVIIKTRTSGKKRKSNQGESL